MEQNNWKNNPQETRGWEIVKSLNDSLKAKDASESVALRKLLAEYMKLGCKKPSRLHSAILSCAVKMAVTFPDFHFVPFLDLWGLENLRQEDSNTLTDESGKRLPSLAERMTKAYAYSLLFHPEERLSAEAESMIKPTLIKKGFVTKCHDSDVQIVISAIATRTFHTEVRRRKMLFVQLLTEDGEEIITEVHTVTAFSKIRYNEIEGRLYNVILRTSDNGKRRVEAMCLSQRMVADCFETAIGYIEHVDTTHCHIHVFDNLSRHFVSKYSTPTTVRKEGQYVEFIPVIPKEGNFKSAIIVRMMDNGPEVFGYRNVVITYSDEEKGFAAWELLPESDGEIHPIVESNAMTPQVPATKGYINQSLATTKGMSLPKIGDKLRIITFLKRGKDGKKRPVVVDYITQER